MVKGVGILASQSNRARLYLQRMAQRDMLPSVAVFLEDPESRTVENVAKERTPARLRTVEADGETYDLECDVADWLETHGVPVQRIEARDPNHAAVVAAVEQATAEVMIYAGPVAYILREPMLSLVKRFLQVHPGIVPNYRGSTT